MAKTEIKAKILSFFVGYTVTFSLMMAMAISMRKLALKREKNLIASKKKNRLGKHCQMNYSYKSVSVSSFGQSIPRNFSNGSQMSSLENRSHAKQTRQLGHWTMNRKLVLAMVGLPARGKSHIVSMILRYLRWIGFPAKRFNVGEYRRKLGYSGVEKSFFDSKNLETKKIREEILKVALNDMYQWLKSDDEAKVAILDATNTTKERRKMLVERAREERHTMIVFIESICDDPKILQQNYTQKLKNEDYVNKAEDEALKDFKERINAYEEIYETIEDCEINFAIRYMKLFNVGQKVVTRNCRGYLPSQVAFFLQNIHIEHRKIWLCGCAESTVEFSESGEDWTEDLTEEGRRFSITVAKYIKSEQENFGDYGPGKDILVLAGTEPLYKESIAHLQMLYPVATTPLLNDLGRTEGFYNGSSGQCLGKSNQAFDVCYEEPIKECYSDVVQRIRPIIIELERQKRSLVIVCHVAVQRCLYAYYMGMPLQVASCIELPFHGLVELVPNSSGAHSRAISLSEMLETL